LRNIILAINTNVKVQSSSSGASEAKAEALTTLGDAAFEVAGAVLSFAEKSGDPALAVRVKFARTAITGGSSNAVVARCQDIIDAATENLESLPDHGVTTAKVNALKQKLKTYDGLRVMPRQAKAAAAAATRQLERLFAEADRLLAKRIDRLMWQFRASAPDFCDRYHVARTIVDAPTPGAEPQPTVAPVVSSGAAIKAAQDVRATASSAAPASATSPTLAQTPSRPR
jgi:hypothetical protein